jgi:hypothetical protein
MNNEYIYRMWVTKNWTPPPPIDGGVTIVLVIASKYIFLDLTDEERITFLVI